MELRRAGSRASPTDSWQAALLKGTLGFGRHGSIWWLAALSGPPNSWTAFVRRCCMSHVTLLHLHRLPEPEELPGGVRPIADQPVRSGAQATSAAAGPLSPVPGWVGMARVMLPSMVFALPSIRCQPCCAPHSAPLKLLFLGSSPLPVISACSSQLVPYDACCLPVRAWDTYISALGRTSPSCGRGCCNG
jgi:hypothetical protein